MQRQGRENDPHALPRATQELKTRQHRSMPAAPDVIVRKMKQCLYNWPASEANPLKGNFSRLIMLAALASKIEPLLYKNLADQFWAALAAKEKFQTYFQARCDNAIDAQKLNFLYQKGMTGPHKS